METRKLGESDLYISPLILGGNVFGWTTDKKIAFNLLNLFTHSGFNCIDTANSYSKWVKGNRGGESETIIGEWLKVSGKRKDIILFTKVGEKLPDDSDGLSEGQIIKQIELSLKRLHTDYIDVYFSHRDDLDTTVEETLGAYDKLIKAGKVRYIGASNFSCTRLRESLNVSLLKQLPGYIVTQPRYNLIERGYEKDIEPFAKRHKMAVVAHSALADGFLSGKYKTEEDLSKSVRGKTVSKFLDKGSSVISKLEKMARETGYPSAALALGWILKNKSITAPIASATSVSQLIELMRVAEPELMDLPLESLSEEGELI